MTIEEIKKDSWYNGPTAPIKEIQIEFDNRKKKVKEIINEKIN